MEIRVADIMSTKIISVNPEDSVLEAVKKMIASKIGNVLVISKNKIKGILTEKDLITKIISKNLLPEKFKVKQLMTKKVITAKKEMTIQDAARLMINKGIHRLPVTTKGNLIGIITANDLLRVQPGLIDVLIEKYKYLPSFTEHCVSGICEKCNSYSNNLIRINGSLICPKCKNHQKS